MIPLYMGRSVARTPRRSRRIAAMMTPSSMRAAWNVGQYAGRAARRFLSSRSPRRTFRQQRARYNNNRNSVVKSGVAGISSSGCKSRNKLYPSVRTILRAAQLSTYKILDTARVEWDAGSQTTNQPSAGLAVDVGLLFANIGASATGQDTTRMVVKNYRLKTSITNQSNANCMITLYDIEYKSDTFANVDWVTPLGAWTTGLARQETGGDSPGITNVGSTPFQSSDFCRHYKVVKVTKLYLDPGKSHMHYYNKRCNKMLNNGINDDTVQQYGIRGFSHSQLLVCQGMPVNDGTTDTNIAFGSGAVDVITEKVYEQCYPQYGLKRYYFDNNQGTITTEKIINDETNAADTYAEV